MALPLSGGTGVGVAGVPFWMGRRGSLWFRGSGVPGFRGSGVPQGSSYHHHHRRRQRQSEEGSRAEPHSLPHVDTFAPACPCTLSLCLSLWVCAPCTGPAGHPICIFLALFFFFVFACFRQGYTYLCVVHMFRFVIHAM